MSDIISAIQTLMVGLLCLAAGYWILAKVSSSQHNRKIIHKTDTFDDGGGSVLESTLGDAELECTADTCSAFT
jgi:hypothetical protein